MNDWRETYRSKLFDEAIARAFRLGIGEAHALVTAVLACVSLLPEDISCLRQGLLEELCLLVELLRSREGRTPELEDLNKLIDDFFADDFAISLDMISRLRQMLYELPPDSAQTYNWLYYISAPGWTPPRKEDNEQRLTLMLYTLAQATRQPSGDVYTHPLLTFVSLITSRQSVPAGVAFIKWIDDAAHALGIAAPVVGPVDLVPPDRVLLIAVEPTFLQRDERYKIQAWIYEGERSRRLTDVGAPAVPLTAFSSRVAELLKMLQVQPFGFDELTMIEIALPHELLLSGIERGISVEDARGRKVALETIYPIVNRLSERVIHGIEQANWQRFAPMFRNVSHQPLDRELYWVNTAQECSLVDLSLALTEHMSLGLVIAPRAETLSNDLLRDAIEALYVSGTPIAIFVRSLTQPALARAVIERLVLGDTEMHSNSASLPTTLLNLRREASASGDPAHPGHHLMLIWDDPNRSIPQMNLSLPEALY